MWTTLLALAGTLKGQAVLAGVALWALGLFAKSAAYKKIRERLGRLAYGLGARLSSLATARLGRLTWGPLENTLADFLGFSVEQFFAGLRSDNVEKLEARLESLEEVGSQARAKAVAAKLEALSAAPDVRSSDAEILARAVAAGDASAQEKLMQ